MGLSMVEIKVGALSIIKKSQRDDADNSKITTYIWDIQYLRKGFRFYKFLHILRMANIVVHVLEVEGLKQGEQSYLRNGVSDYGEKLLEHDQKWV